MPINFIDIKCVLGKKIINNKILEKKYKWNKDQIFKKTGILKRFVSSKNQTVKSLAFDALRKLKKKNKIDNASFLIFVSNTSASEFPSVAHELSSRFIENKEILPISINSGCTGFVEALSLMIKLLNKKKKIGIIVTSDTYSKFLDNNDKSTNSLFSDGASATLIKYNSTGYKIKKEIHLHKKHSLDKIYKNNKYIIMKGPEVLLFSLNDVIPILKKIIKNDYYIAIHQAGKIIIESIKRNINKKIFIPTNFRNYGNLISTSIPKLLEENRKLLKKKKLLITGFGVGLSQSHILLDYYKK